MSDLQIAQFVCRSDNFGLLIHDPVSGLTASIDTPDGEAILHELSLKGWKLTHIFNTHHHYDHIPGNALLKERTGCTIVGAKNDAHRIPLIDVKLADGEIYPFGSQTIKMLATPGHTLGSVCYFIEPEQILFTGDTLFSMGCGRLFEGTAEMMQRSLEKISQLPDETKIYCGHEYTLTNAAFALEIEPDNEALRARMEEVKRLRRAHKATLPVTLGLEKATNPFLRADQPDVQKFFDLEGAPKANVFAATRARRNDF